MSKITNYPITVFVCVAFLVWCGKVLSAVHLVLPARAQEEFGWGAAIAGVALVGVSITAGVAVAWEWMRKPYRSN